VNKRTTNFPVIEHPIIERFIQPLLEWFYRYGRQFPWRDNASTPYSKIIAEILLQRTHAEMVSKQFIPFLSRFGNWEELANAKDDEIADFLKPLGIWKRKTISLKNLSLIMMERYEIFPSTREELEKLPGVGQYIASSILLFIFNQPEALLDVNMARVLERYFGPRQLADIRYDPYLQKLAKEVVNNPDPVSTNYAILDLAALICTNRNPECIKCPLNKECLFNLSNNP
jgi:A/G-specific adenine glycosylase